MTTTRKTFVFRPVTRGMLGDKIPVTMTVPANATRQQAQEIIRAARAEAQRNPLASGSDGLDHWATI